MSKMHPSATTYLSCNICGHDREQQMLLMLFLTLQINSCLYTLPCPFPGPAPHPHLHGPVDVALHYAHHQCKDLSNNLKQH